VPVLDSGENAEKALMLENVALSKRLLNLSLEIILAIAYFLTGISTGGRAYNMIVASALVGFSIGIRLISENMLKRIVRYMFLTGVVMGIAGASPPLYFAIFHGIISSIELMFSIGCIVLTVITLFRMGKFKML